MSELAALVDAAVADFRQVALLAKSNEFLNFRVEIVSKPHKPPAFPANSMAVYAFFFGEQCLKVGKVGPKSGPRFRYQHYNVGSARSTLAGSIISNPAKVGQNEFDKISAGEWIKKNTDRVTIIPPFSQKQSAILALLESFLHVRWMPLFEGKPITD